MASPEDLKGGSARRVPRTLPDTVDLGAFVPVLCGGVGAWCARKQRSSSSDFPYCDTDAYQLLTLLTAKSGRIYDL